MLPCLSAVVTSWPVHCAFLLPSSFHPFSSVRRRLSLFSSGSVRVISAFLGPRARAMPHPHLAAFYCVNCSLLPPSLPLPSLLLGGGLAILFLLSPLVSDSLLILPPAVHPTSPLLFPRPSSAHPKSRLLAAEDRHWSLMRGRPVIFGSLVRHSHGSLGVLF